MSSNRMVLRGLYTVRPSCVWDGMGEIVVEFTFVWFVCVRRLSDKELSFEIVTYLMNYI